MFRWNKNILPALGLILLSAFALSATSRPAHAGDDLHLGVILGWSTGYGYPHHDHGRYQRYHEPYYMDRRDHHRGYRHHFRPGSHAGDYRFRDGYRDHRRYLSRGGRACHLVYRTDYWRGHRAVIGATMCYDRYGAAYVIRGSEYLIRRH